MKHLKSSLRFLLICVYLNTLGFSMFAPLYALFALNIGAEPLNIGIGWSIYMVVGGLLIIAFGRAEDRVPNKLLLIVSGYFWLAAVSLMFLLVESTAWLYLVLALNAIGSGMVVPASRAVFGALEDKGKEASEWSLFDGGSRVVMGVAAIIGGLLVKLQGFDAVFIAMFVIQLLAAIVSLRLIKHSREFNQS